MLFPDVMPVEKVEIIRITPGTNYKNIKHSVKIETFVLGYHK